MRVKQKQMAFTSPLAEGSKALAVWITLEETSGLSVPSISVLVTTLIWLLARSFPLKEELSWSTDTIREPECFFFISTSVVCNQRDGCNISHVKYSRHSDRSQVSCHYAADVIKDRTCLLTRLLKDTPFHLWSDPSFVMFSNVGFYSNYLICPMWAFKIYFFRSLSEFTTTELRVKPL